MHNFIESPICMGPERIKNPFHPTQKPVRVLERIIRVASKQGDVVFDPFMGVGSTGVAALNLGRKFIGIEIDEKYFRAAEERLEMAAARLKLF
jgi:site-specific DNA-methyltransferase (adenine-specific)/modification methylase